MYLFLKRIVKKILRIFFNWPRPKPKLEDILRKNGMKIGTNIKILEGCIIDDSHYWHIEIGDDVTLAPRVHILAHDASTKTHLNYTKIKNVFIGNRVFIGASSIVMPGVRIGDNAIIGAGSVVTRDVPENSVFAGNPAKFICRVEDYLEKEKAEMNKENMFDESFTLRGAIDAGKKIAMKDAVSKHGKGYVI